MMEFVTSPGAPGYVADSTSRDKSLLEIQIVRSLLDVASSTDVANEESLAASIGYSLAQSHRLCMELLGESAHAFVTRLRLECAAGRLASEGLSINEVFEDAGFAARESFARAFNEHFACSPSEFRNRNANRILPFPGYVLAQGDFPSGQVSVRVLCRECDPITFLYDGPVFLGRVLPGRVIDWRSKYHGNDRAQ